MQVDMSALDLELLTDVESSHIRAVGVRDDYLVVQFKSGAVYRYPDIGHLFDDLVGADSIGKYFHSEIRDRSCQRLRGEWPEED